MFIYNNSDAITYDAVIIGGGFYGCMIALHLKKTLKNVLIIEQESDLMLRASRNNQARVHNGYHYPRNYLTAASSHKNYPKFIEQFKEAMVDNFDMVYAITKNSKTSVENFLKLYKKIGSPIYEATPEIKDLFNPKLVEAVFTVDEMAFDVDKLRQIIKNKLRKAKVNVLYNQEVQNVKGGSVCCGSFNIPAKRIISCVYARTNFLLRKINLPELPIKLEMTEMPIVTVPEELKDKSITIMDGPFFSIFPFPVLEAHTIHHVAYTPRNNQTDLTNFKLIMKDVKKFIPSMKKVKHNGSIWEMKAVLYQNEEDDGRPITFKRNYQIRDFDVVVGGKLDNIYDVIKKLDGADEELNIIS